MQSRAPSLRVRSSAPSLSGSTWLGLLALAALLLSACEQKKKEAPQAPAAASSALEEEPAPRPRSIPSFSIDEVSPQVGFSRVLLTTPEGHPNRLGPDQLREELSSVKEFIENQPVTLQVHRKARPEWVSLYLEELAALGATPLTVQTDTRGDLPASLPFVAERSLQSPPSCTLAGVITADRGTAVWRISGGAARKRGRGMGGPDLTMTGDTIASLAQTCASDLFFVHGAEGIEWGLIYDLAATGLSLEQGKQKRAVVPRERPTPGHALSLTQN